MSFTPIPVRDNLVHFVGKQGSTWACVVTLNQTGTTTPVDLTDYSIRGQIKKAYTDTAATATFVCTKTDAVAGKFSITLSSESTAALSACKTPVDSTNYTSADKNGTYIYDIEIYKGSPETVYRALQGTIYVDAEVTK